ncbi:hypothetical protein WJX72_002275 [[Myrmecia] bisecta]|uniref:Uncharacterized protein n=1 Tax=[Myrmecia] bisecta TaxID=41462 RepID=A0AAW1R4B1_9CHLO
MGLDTVVAERGSSSLQGVRCHVAQPPSRCRDAAYAHHAVAVHDAFVCCALQAQAADRAAPSEAETKQAITDYVAMLKAVYSDLILEPHVVTAEAMSCYSDPARSEEAAHLRQFRLLQRRFILYQQAATPLSSQPANSFALQLPDQLQVEQASGEATSFSFSLQDTDWKAGCVSKKGLKGKAGVVSSLEASQAGRRPGRLYFTDGTIPAYNGIPEDAPGTYCLVNNAANSMLPAEWRSDRADNLFYFMKVESTGTASFTLFAPIGGGCNLTAFHQETKKRRSWNCGAGDFIVQPLATAENVRKMERVHAAVTGQHVRHGQLLPLEMYLEEGIPLVLALRDKPGAEMVELPEQSMHAFLSWGTANSCPPALKVSCNDWCVRDEMSSAYLLEKLVPPLAQLGVEEGFPADDAHTWTESAYFTREPFCVGRQRGSHWPAGLKPWAEELQAEPDGAAVGASLQEQRSWQVEVILAEAALAALYPALLDLCERAQPEQEVLKDESAEAAGREDVNFTREYLLRTVQDVARVLMRKVPPAFAAVTPGSPPQSAGHQPPTEIAAAAAGQAFKPFQLPAAPRADAAGKAARDDACVYWAYMVATGQERAGIGEAAEAKSHAELLKRPATLRSHWLLALQLEWEAAQACRAGKADLQLLAQCRSRRCALENLSDNCCCQLLCRYHTNWSC